MSLLKLLNGRKWLLTEFDEILQLALVHQMKVHSATEFTFPQKHK